MREKREEIAHTDILLINGYLLLIPGETSHPVSGYLKIQGTMIVELGAMADLSAETVAAWQAVGRVMDAQGGLVMPGLVNTHAHSAMTLFRGLADDLPLMTWLEQYIFPAEAAQVKPEMVYWCSRLAAAEMILSGTTLVADGYFYEGEVARAFAAVGLRGVVAQGVIDFPAPGVPDPRQKLAVVEGFIQEWQGGDPLLTPAVFAHSPYTCGNETLVAAKGLAKEHGLSFFTHLAETKGDFGLIQKPQGKTVLQHLHALRLLDSETIGVHGVYLDEADGEIAAETGMGIATCPQSNMKLAAGIAPLVRLRRQGISLGLGTDGCGSNNSLDLFREMDLCAKGQKIVGPDPVALPAEAVLAMATHQGAKVLGFEGQLGRLAPGYLADLIILKLNQPRLQPFHHPNLLVYSGSGQGVETVIINGQVVLEAGKLTQIDLAETMAAVRRLAKKMGSRMAGGSSEAVG